ncbi:cbb3-type cytochrome c oxidase subunit I [Sulfobacillus harzensis]|uniref:Cytochrome c oxidase subunit 1 n=1 Tax=Sulfobacillus harzensis TaxID=2729629 RepID=A0A7Y0Q135_9FIRM|nr:cbb3-type cytochrome c oxidase subunit I [Sulfobacillus harzensis]NMP20885.1 cytochrome ubiquinol oxidase subunit I [Sulfobacillus harzensis]
MPSFIPYLIHILFPPSVRLPDILLIDFGLVVGGLGILGFLTKTKRWGWLWREWLTTVDHKKIAVLYLIAALLMLMRGGIDAMMIRAQLALPSTKFMPATQYNEVFTTHGTIMIFFMAMPFIFALFNAVVPLMIGARDVAFPRLNAMSYWLFAAGAILFNISFIIGGSPNAGWTAYPPYTGLAYNPGPAENYYFVALLIAGMGTTMTGINFLVTTVRMRAPGMTLMKMPLFIWSAMVTSALILFAFPPLTVALAMSLFDRIFGSSFFTLAHGGMPMMYVNLFWLFGHPEVYILVIPLFGVFSEVVSTYSKKALFGYPVMVVSILAIMFLSYGTWVHHFFTMGAGPGVNAFFGLSTMLIAIPTGVKIFNWIFTMWGGRIQMTTSMLYQLAFIPTFVIGGATGVLLAVVPADYQFHNTYFLVAHFHNVIIGGTLFGLLSGLYYWWPKMFGMKLNERQGKVAFWLFFIGFWVTFTPQYLLGLKGMTRRIYTYPVGFGWHELNVISTVGAFIMGAAFVALVYNIIWSLLYGERDLTGDPWDGRTLEWSIPSPAPEYNFARIPVVHERDAWWAMKQNGQSLADLKPEDIRDIEMPRNSAIPFLLGVSFFVGGFGLTFKWWPIAIIGGLAVVACLLFTGFDYDDHHHLDAEFVRRTEASLGRLQG